MRLSVIQKLIALGLACGELMLVSASLARPAHAQLSEGDRVSRLRALQSSVLNRATGAAGASSGQVGGVEAISPEPSIIGPSTVSPASPPLPEAGREVIATATPINGRLSIALINNTGTRRQL